MTLALWLLAYLLISYGIGKLYEVTVGWRGVTYVFYPAMLVAAVGRLLAAVLSNQKIGQLDLLRSGGPARGGSDKLPGGWWFRFLYAILPFAVSVGCFVLAWHLLDEPISFHRTLPVLGFEQSAVGKGVNVLGSFLGDLFSSFGDQKLGDWQMWVFLYLGSSLIVASAPSRDDLISVGGMCGVIGLVVLALGQAGVKVVASGVYGGAFWKGFSFLIAMSLFVIVATVAILLPVKFIRSSKES